ATLEEALRIEARSGRLQQRDCGNCCEKLIGNLVAQLRGIADLAYSVGEVAQQIDELGKQLSMPPSAQIDPSFAPRMNSGKSFLDRPAAAGLVTSGIFCE